MSILFDYGEKCLTNDFKENINNQLCKEIQNFRNWDSFRVVINLENLDVSELSYEEIVLGKSVMEIIAKMSRDLWIDYDYYQHFSFSSQYDTLLYTTRLTNLGFVNENGLWRSTKKPDIKDVQLNIFVFCLYQLMIDKKERVVLDRENMVNANIEQRNTIRLAGCHDSLDVGQLADTHDNITSAEIKSGILHADSDNQLITDIERNNLIPSGILVNQFMKTCPNCEIDFKEDGEICSSCLRHVSRSSSVEADTVKQSLENDSLSKRSESAEFNIDLGTQVVGVSESDSWTCLAGTYRNKLSNEKCYVCNTNKPMNAEITGWSCTSCSFKNQLENEFCEICFIDRGDRSSSDVSESDDNRGSMKCSKKSWNCPNCKCEYPYDRYMCVKCQKYAPFFNDWICEKCTFVNNKNNKKCVACSTRNNHLKTCSKCKINYFNKDIDHECTECHSKAREEYTEYDVVKIVNGRRHILYWICTFCEEHNGGTNCSKCKNTRHLSSHKKCTCNWSNLPIKNFCGNCHKPLGDLSSIVPRIFQ